MQPRLSVAIFFWVLSISCATQHRVRLDTGQGMPLEHRLPTPNKSVAVGADDFEEALALLVLHAPLALHPPPSRWLVRTSSSGPAQGPRWQDLVSKSFGGICKPGQRRADCLSILDDVMGLSPWDKLGVALGLSLEPMRASISKAVENTLAPQLFYTVIATGLISWAALAANPEPVFTKAAAIISAVLLIYLGVETFLELVDASRELKRATDRATTPEELQHAGQRYATRVGPEVSRVVVLAATVVVSHGMAGGAAWLAARVPMLPRFSEAAALGASQLRLTLAEVGQVSAVAVVGGTIVISLPATAMAMGSSGTPSVKAPHIDVPKHNLSRLAPTWTEQRQILIDAVRQLDGKVNAVATNPSGTIFEGTLQVRDRLGNLVDLTIRWFKYADGSITINTAFVPP